MSLSTDIKPTLTTREAMDILNVKTHAKLNEILTRYHIKPEWRGGKGNVYLGKDIQSIFSSPIDMKGDPFYDHVNG